MFSTMEIVVGGAVSLLGYYYFRKFNRSGQSIPAPFALSFFGHLFFIEPRSYNTLTKWSKTYGSIFKLKLGSVEAIVLSDPALIREAFGLSSISGRNDLKSFSLLTEGKNGILSADGDSWTEQRRFAVRHLRDFGFGRKSMESMIMEEVNESMEAFRKEAGQPVLVELRFSIAVLNSLWQIVTGNRFSHDDPKLNAILKQAQEVFGVTSVNLLVIFFPGIAQLLPKLTGWSAFEDTCTAMRNFFKEQITEHKKTFEENSNSPRDIIDTYLKEISQTTDPKSSFYKEMGEKQLVAVISDMFNAGSETTSNTLQWALLYLSQDQNAQKKLRDEINRVIGKSRAPSLEDRSSMPYTEAMIMEILRKSCVVPQSLHHKVMVDTEFHGYHFPKGCNVMANFYGIHQNPAIWGDPQNFRPERFIDEHGQCVKKHDALMAFSIGKRACIGETLARDTIFLFLTSIFQSFEVLPDPASKVSFQAKLGFLLAPEPYKVIFNEIN